MRWIALSAAWLLTVILPVVALVCVVCAQNAEVGGRSSMISSVSDSNQYIHLTWMPESNAPTYFPQFSTNTTDWATFTNVTAQTGQMGATFFMGSGQTAYLRVVRGP